jgi:tetratricopeptide (TPR) repeat protein
VVDGTFTDGSLTVTVDVRDTADGPVFDFTSNIGVDAVFVKGGPAANFYSYSPEGTGDTGLHAPINPNNNQFFGLFHISFCYDVGTPLSDALSELQAMADGPNKRVADKAEDAAAQIEKALAEQDKGDVAAAFGALEGAAGDLEAMVKETGQGQAELDAVVAFARQLAADAGANLTEGDALEAQGKYKDAVAKYKDAYDKAA